LHQIEDRPNHKGRISLPGSLVLTREPPQYVIGDGEAARFVFPVLDNLREFADAMESAINSNRKSADRPNTIAREPEARADFVNVHGMPSAPSGSFDVLISG
jgi:hypothetical protein